MNDLKTELRWRLRRLTSPGDFLIFHLGRSGSTVLSALLNQHPAIYCAEEIFHGFYSESARTNARQRGRSPDTKWTLSSHYPHDPKGFWRLQGRYVGWRQAFGFEVKPYHIDFMNQRVDGFLNLVRRDGFKRLIVLKRRNYLRKVVSAQASKARKQMHIQAGAKPAQQTITIDPAHIDNDSRKLPLLTFFKQYDAAFRAVEAFTAARPDLAVLNISYEDDIQHDPRVAFDKVCRHLGLPPVDVRVTLGRTNPFALPDLIANYDEVAAHLAGTPYQWMLSD